MTKKGRVRIYRKVAVSERMSIVETENSHRSNIRITKLYCSSNSLV
ncbi:hypothetical protein Bhyg_02869 [Pseudolycoriella hygida]|uniref:Uncharacterized protein n=1 Tax=Pseudolycoriella hygida TaxID=35572 RepID=A0A9Q0NDF0_9DIPT|nr:hypothetical protein Bhyg_02869 [Pseudolycoriella hygida]